MTDEEYERRSRDMAERDRIANALADEEDIATGRIKSREHLKAVDTLLDVLVELENTIHYATDGGMDLYAYVNSKSIAELNEFFEKVRSITSGLDKEFGVASED